MSILITILVTTVVVAPIAWIAGANNAKRTLAVTDALKGKSERTD